MASSYKLSTYDRYILLEFRIFFFFRKPLAVSCVQSMLKRQKYRERGREKEREVGKFADERGASRRFRDSISVRTSLPRPRVRFSAALGLSFGYYYHCNTLLYHYFRSLHYIEVRCVLST